MRVSAGILSLVTLFAAVSSGSAALTEFPYEAVVETDGVVVRSGPGERYDPTLKLNTGQQVTVHRHDPGGWYMISPPPGSFSWIDGQYVERTGEGTGTVKVPQRADGLPPRVVVWIGSEFTNEHKYFGRQLADGDSVRILGEKPGRSDGGATTFYKITPPRLEYRWVKGDFVVPLSESNQIARGTSTSAPAASEPPNQTNPFAAPISQQESLPSPGFPPEASEPLKQRDLTRGINSPTAKDHQLSPDVATQRSKLYALDDQLKAMLAQIPHHWDLAGMEQAYRQLQAEVSPAVAGQIEARLAAIDARKKIKAEYDAFIKVITKTEQRDAALLSMQQSLAAGIPPAAPQVELGQADTFPPNMTNGEPTPTPAFLQATTQPVPTPDALQLVGAGIVQRVPATQSGVPPFALLAPDGRHLAYLRPADGITLEQAVNQPTGVFGQRTFDAGLQSDLIIVKQTSPVRLQP